MKQTICYGCMQPIEAGEVCPHCGFDGSRQNEPHQLPMGTVLQDNYILGWVLGQGGFGITYIGWDLKLSSTVAIKEYFPGGLVYRNADTGHSVSFFQQGNEAMFEKHKRKFLKEARALAKLTHVPAVVNVRSFFEENNTAYIVMEYVQGITLKQYLKNRGKPMTFEACIQVMRPVMDALQVIHDNQLVHRDISPDNIMVQEDGSAKLIDFGAVKNMIPSGSTTSADVVLKLMYAPLEQYRENGNLGPWTDVYALCATFHFLLTGQAPLDAVSRLESGDDLQQLDSVKGLPDHVREALRKGMALRAAQRLQSVGELRQLLEAKPSRTEKKGTARILGAAAAAMLVLGMLFPVVKNRTDRDAAVMQTEPSPAGILSGMEEGGETAPMVPGETEQAQVSFGESITNILLVGRTGGFGTEDQFADAMVLVTIDQGNGRVTLTSLLRDTYVVIPEYKGRFNSPNKLSVCYPLGYTLGGTGGAMEMTRQCLLDSFGVDVDYIIEADFDAFRNAVDLLGGIPVELSAEEASYLNRLPDRWQQVSEGTNRLYGDAALDYVRMCYHGSDIQRTERLRTLLCSARDVLCRQDPHFALSVVAQTLTTVRSDMTASQAETLARELIPVVWEADICTGTCPAEGSYWVEMIDLAGFPQYVLQFEEQRCKREMAAITGN